MVEDVFRGEGGLLKGDKTFAGGVPTTTVGFATGSAAVFAAGSAAGCDFFCGVLCVGCSAVTTTVEESEGRLERTA